MGNLKNKNSIKNSQLIINNYEDLNKLKEDNAANNNEDNYKIVVGIDFGTAGIGYAYSFYNDQKNIILSDFHGQTADHKVPSEIILDNNLEDILAFGNECKRYIKTHNKSENKYEYFKNIKMNLYHKINEIKSTNGRQANIETIISKMLEAISKNALSQIKKSSNDFLIKKEDIKWIVTIPAIWDEKSKEIMINASIKAELIKHINDKSLFLALESEVAGIYYYSSIYMDSKFEDPHIKAGLPYIICDIGAGTVDICTHKKVIKNDKTSELIEEYPPIGGDYGGNKINEEFIKRLIIEIFGEEKVNKLQSNIEYEDWDKFEKEIEELKKSAFDNEGEELTLDCILFEDNEIKKTLKDYIFDYNNKNHIHNYTIKTMRRWELIFPSKIFYDISKELSKKIFEKIEEIYNNVGTGYIIITGAGSKNYTITNNLYNFANEKKIKINIITPSYPETAIIRGAVLFGFQNNIIRKRKAKYTLGIKASNKWEEKYKGKGIKEYDEIEKEDHCRNLFSKIITINQYIPFDKIIQKNYKALNPNPKIIFYKTYKENCTFINEKDGNGKLIIFEFGKLDFNIGNDFDINNRDVIIEIRLGGTYIDGCAILKKNGKKLPIYLSFLN